MREILFRGKRVDNNEWVYGFLSKSRGNNHFLSLCIDHEENGVMLSSIVEPETIGQYTGLCDKNGVKIFEGDIIKVHKSDTYVIKYGEYTPRNYCLARYYDKPTIGFYAYDGERCFQLSTNSRCYEVIGNIHDNPELAEGLL
mgnify:CR=1 FL=1